MSDISAILMPEDKVAFALWLIGTHQARFVVDDDLPAITELVTIDAIKPNLLADDPRLVFVTSPLWTSLPLYKAPAMNANRGPIHYITQRYGGPAFTWLPGNVLRDREPAALSAGLFGDYASYYRAPGEATLVDRPLAMAAAFKAARAWVKRTARRRRTVFSTGATGPWISHDAWLAVRDRSACLANDHLALAADAA